MTELQPRVERLTETVLHLNLGYFVVLCFSCLFWFGLVFFPFDETTTELLLRHQLQD
jgi:hypothetical protein